jgi:hypothetical protein
LHLIPSAFSVVGATAVEEEVVDEASSDVVGVEEQFVGVFLENIKIYFEKGCGRY